jgi:hypothetical protein
MEYNWLDCNLWARKWHYCNVIASAINFDILKEEDDLIENVFKVGFIFRMKDAETFE